MSPWGSSTSVSRRPLLVRSYPKSGLKADVATLRIWASKRPEQVRHDVQPRVRSTYSITSSASASRLCGIVRPSVLPQMSCHKCLATSVLPQVSCQMDQPRCFERSSQRRMSAGCPNARASTICLIGRNVLLPDALLWAASLCIAVFVQTSLHPNISARVCWRRCDRRMAAALCRAASLCIAVFVQTSLHPNISARVCWRRCNRRMAAALCRAASLCIAVFVPTSLHPNVSARVCRSRCNRRMAAALCRAASLCIAVFVPTSLHPNVSLRVSRSRNWRRLLFLGLRM